MVNDKDIRGVLALLPKEAVYYFTQASVKRAMPAEEFADGKPIRRLWGTRIKKFGERWMANVLEVETIGSGHRTKITVEELK